MLIVGKTHAKGKHIHCAIDNSKYLHIITIRKKKEWGNEMEKRGGKTVRCLSGYKKIVPQ